ncbi:WecB/TagA/CpsF family glycosyltransferase [Gloeocapsopsis crepidinum LEGE 06123]|uniref:WecB/TagA/CpsF family glycosyltransferase n=1 Tax=Gloeocapsopsis crepidinum LEGE 06123 TaxID=588587 RepID=A0ABR9UST0_9CHRO|nr:WecB/TagA/CpsF family glycosyltransferase [Gloeocapsopsis crepidinum]MBE9191355.1 WecB/TagA/CpsF family glycosyltransferase [Gloeocapsopsis crepidinum LEGE 06123]
MSLALATVTTEKYYLQIVKTVVNVIDLPVTALSLKEQLEIILNWASHFESKTVCVANVHMLMEACKNPNFSTVLKDADLVTPDGMPLVWIMKLMGAPWQNRVAGMDILLSLCHLAPKRNTSLFFLGSTTKILEKMKEEIHDKFPDLQIAGMESLPFRPLTEEEDRAIIQKINSSGAGVVLVSLGCPKQEYWIDQHKGKIHAVMIGLGGAFPVFAGIHKRAPFWMRNMGLEWLYRLIQEPRRLWYRYLTTIPPFLFLASVQLITSRLSIWQRTTNLWSQFVNKTATNKA